MKDKKYNKELYNKQIKLTNNKFINQKIKLLKDSEFYIIFLFYR